MFAQGFPSLAAAGLLLTTAFIHAALAMQFLRDSQNPPKMLCVCVCTLSHLGRTDSLRPHGLQPSRLLCPRRFSRQEYWSRLPCPPPGHLPGPAIKSRSPTLRADSLPSESPGKLTPYHQIPTVGVQTVKKLPAMRETCIPSWVRKISWRREWPLSILAWEIPWTEARDGLSSMRSQRVKDS